TIGLQIPLFSGWSQFYDVRAATATARAADERRKGVEQLVIFQVFNSFYALRTATQRVRTSGDLLASAVQSEQVALGRYRAAAGTAEPRQTVSVQSQVTGVLTRVAFREGDDVEAGEMLFQIDPRPFQAALDQARAMLARDQAQARSAVLDAQRYAELVKQDYVTKSDYDAKRANAEALQAVVRADSAAVANAELNLEWAT